MTQHSGEFGIPTETPHCAGRLAVAHVRTAMVGGCCPVCGERDHCYREDNCAAHEDHQGDECCCCGLPADAHEGCDCD